MTELKFVELVLTCGSWQEAQRIADELLQQRLIACVEFIEVKSKYHWHGKLEQAAEIKLIMETVGDKFEKIEAEIAKLHSYTNFVLYAVPIAQISKQAAHWLEAETQ